MINTLWFNLKKPDGSAPVVLAIPAAGGTGLLQQIINCATVYNRGELAGIELEVIANGVAPGAAKTLTVKYAFSSYDNRNVAELATAAASQAITLENTASVRQCYSLPVVYQGAQYLHVWFDCSALAAGAELTLELRVNARTGG